MQDVEPLDRGELCLITYCCYQSYKLPSFLSDHLDELTGCAREDPSTDKALYPACFLKDASCPLNKEGNWTSPFHGGKMGAFEMRRVGFCFHVIVMHLSARGNDRQQIREAEARWLMPALSDWQRQTHHCFSSLASLVINPVCLILKVEAPLSAGSWSCALKSIPKNKVIFRSMQLWSFCLVGLNNSGLLEEMVSLLSILCTGDIHRMSKCIWVHMNYTITVLSKSSVNVNSKTRYLDEVLQIKTLLKPWPAFPSPSAHTAQEDGEHL